MSMPLLMQSAKEGPRLEARRRRRVHAHCRRHSPTSKDAQTDSCLHASPEMPHAKKEERLHQDMITLLLPVPEKQTPCETALLTSGPSARC